ncbi:MAG: DUF1587 domain-containing protein, partial [Verrucomicrobiota bacterium]
MALLCGLTGAASDAKTPFSEEVYQFVQTYCVSCHGEEKQKGDRVFHELAVASDEGRWIDLANEEQRYLLEDLLDQLNLGEMPPKKEGVKQPSREEIAATTKWVTETLLEEESAQESSHTVLRRLNRREYRHTMEDLLGLQNLPFDPTFDFPADDIEEGFTNVGEALSLSESHLDQYLRAADRYLDMAVHVGEIPESTRTVFPSDGWGAPRRQAVTPWSYWLVTKEGALDIGFGHKDLSRYIYQIASPTKLEQRGGIQRSGYYTIR